MKRPFELEAEYLAGIIEGNGTFYVPKTQRCIKTNRLLYPSISLSFHSKNLPLAEELRNYFNFGIAYKEKKENACRWDINNKEGVLTLINLINGKLRTPKINKLHALIDFIKEKDNTVNIQKLGKSTSKIEENSWFTGFCEADACFYIFIDNKTSLVRCDFKIDQRMIDLSGESCKDFLICIAQFLNVNLHETNRGLYTIMASSKESIKIIIDYFNKYPLKGSKLLDYLDWSNVVELKNNIPKGEKLDIELIRKIKNQMNSKRPF